MYVRADSLAYYSVRCYPTILANLILANREGSWRKTSIEYIRGLDYWRAFTIRGHSTIT